MSILDRFLLVTILNEETRHQLMLRYDWNRQI